MNELKLSEKIKFLILLFTVGGIFGFIYETIFYYIDLGYLVKRGSTFGPWIPIYGFGALLITLFTYKFKDHPLKVFLVTCLVTGLLELGTGYVLNTFFDIRLWDYNVEIWNFGNIGGYVCLRSILFFGISGLFLVYFLIPLFTKIKTKCNEKVFSLISIIPGVLFFSDFVAHIFL